MSGLLIATPPVLRDQIRGHLSRYEYAKQVGEPVVNECD